MGRYSRKDMIEFANFAKSYQSSRKVKEAYAAYLKGIRLKTKEKRIIPKVYGHNLSLTVEGIGSHNPKEYCNCVDCKFLRERRDKIFGGYISRLPKLLLKRLIN